MFPIDLVIDFDVTSRVCLSKADQSRTKVQKTIASLVHSIAEKKPNVSVEWTHQAASHTQKEYA
jgi:hypothetical protein